MHCTRLMLRNLRRDISDSREPNSAGVSSIRLRASLVLTTVRLLWDNIALRNSLVHFGWHWPLMDKWHICVFWHIQCGTSYQESNLSVLHCLFLNYPGLWELMCPQPGTQGISFPVGNAYLPVLLRPTFNQPWWSSSDRPFEKAENVHVRLT